MPRCGSQVVHCDLPVRFDMYRGCGHGCAYCFARNKRDLAHVVPDESPAQLARFLAGHRSAETRWCDWRIPLHFGGVSDPLQPCERTERRTLACLELLAAARYPFILSTKSTLIVEPPWRDVLARCNVAVQVSMVAPAFDALEPGAPPFAQRLKMLPTLARLVPRVIVRVQPFVPAVLAAVLRVLPRYARAGVHGITVEGMKYQRAHGAAGPRGLADPPAGVVKLGSDWVLPLADLEPAFLQLRERCHALGLRFYCAENRLRRLSDHRTCCGTDGLPGFIGNSANLNGPAVGRPLRYRRRMHAPGTAWPFKSLTQSPVGSAALRDMSYAESMELVRQVPGYRAAVGLPPVPGRRHGPRRGPASVADRTPLEPPSTAPRPTRPAGPPAIPYRQCPISAARRTATPTADRRQLGQPGAGSTARPPQSAPGIRRARTRPPTRPTHPGRRNRSRRIVVQAADSAPRSRPDRPYINVRGAPRACFRAKKPLWQPGNAVDRMYISALWSVSAPRVPDDGMIRNSRRLSILQLPYRHSSPSSSILCRNYAQAFATTALTSMSVGCGRRTARF